MDAWSRLRNLMLQLWPILAVVLAVFLQFTALFAWIVTSGASAEAMAAWAIAATGGLSVAAWCGARIRWTQLAVSVLAACAAMVVRIAPLATEFFFSPAVNIGLSGIMVWLVAAIPMSLAALCSGLLYQTTSDQAGWKLVLGTGVGAALLLAHGWIGIPFAVTGIVVGAGTVCGIYSSDEAKTRQQIGFVSDGWLSATVAAVMTVATGMAVVAGGLLLSRLFTVSIATTAVATVFCCLAFGFTFVPILRLRNRSVTWWIVALVAVSILPWCFEVLVNWNLIANAGASSGVVILLRHGFQLGCWLWLLLVALSSGSRLVLSTSSCSPVHLPLFPVGAAICFALARQGVHPGTLIAIPMLVLVVAGLLCFWKSSAIEVTRWSQVAALSVAALAVASFTLNTPDLTGWSRLLFDARPILAIHSGYDPAMIHQSDATRLTDHWETSSGTATKWITQADRVEVRVNGHVVGEASTDTRKMPQPAVEILTSVLPLVLHPHPGSVLLLNDASGVALETCGEFPLHRLVVVQPEVRLADLAQSDDQLLTVLNNSGAEVVRDQSLEPVDVMIDCLVDPARVSAGARLSHNWYRSVAARLAEDGVFCQRLRQQRVSNRIVAQVLGTVSSVFRHAAVVQLAPGELAVLATNSNTPLLDKGTLRRMERQHVRRELGRSGWDWCQLAALPVVHSADPNGLWQSGQLPSSVSADTGAWNIGMMCETLHCTDNSSGLRDMLAPYQMRIADAVPTGESHKEFARRISAYAQQVELSSAFPDEWWSYRNSLKSEMLRNTRPPVEKLVGGEVVRSPHPLDEFRKNYLITLGQLMDQLRESRISTESLDELSDFSADYEPLLSDFAHFELVRIHELGGHPAPADEFRHRLHTVNYSVAGDHSLRNVIGALQQLTEQPELIPDDADRYDQLNSLVQQLVLRWESRMAWDPRSAARTQRDVELSVRFAQKALLQMKDLAADAGFTSDDFATRRQYVAKSLIVPLRQYKEQVLAHRVRESPTLLSDRELLNDEVPMLIDSTLSTN